MDVAALKQLLRNLLALSEAGHIQSSKADRWRRMLAQLPGYQVDDEDDFKEWLWPGLHNNNSHRHASHLYPLFYEMDPEIRQRPALRQAAINAIENRLEYRRDRDGGEMAFGLVQLGLAAAHLRDTEHAYECVDWLCNSYWSPALTSYHDPGRIFNVDICGGLPAVVTEMLVQSSSDRIELLPALPAQWSEGRISGVQTRCGATVGLEWRPLGQVVATFVAQRETSFEVALRNRTWTLKMNQGESLALELSTQPAQEPDPGHD
jgi:hypothetical protein